MSKTVTIPADTYTRMLERIEFLQDERELLNGLLYEVWDEGRITRALHQKLSDTLGRPMARASFRVTASEGK